MPLVGLSRRRKGAKGKFECEYEYEHEHEDLKSRGPPTICPARIDASASVMLRLYRPEAPAFPDIDPRGVANERCGRA